MKYFVYFHKKPDGEIFYVGIGGKKRPYSKYQRNKWWNNIVNKYGYSIELMHENINWTEACQLEIKYIKQIGRADLKLGPLVNLTDGGDGTIGVICSDETRIKKSLSLLGKKRSAETKNKISSSKKGIKFSKTHIEKLRNSDKAVKPIVQFNLDGTKIQSFTSIKEACALFKNPKAAQTGITQCVNNYPNRKSSNGFIWKFETK